VLARARDFNNLCCHFRLGVKPASKAQSASCLQR
jgi:hypothetical protein